MDDARRLRQLEPLIGEWTTTITMIEPDGSDGAVSAASDIYTWSANRKFIQHDVDADMGEDGRVLSLEIIALDPSGPGYVSRSYDPDGTFSDFVCQRDGRTWRVIGARQRFEGQFSHDGLELSGEWEQDGGTGIWSPLIRVRLIKSFVGAAAGAESAGQR